MQTHEPARRPASQRVERGGPRARLSAWPKEKAGQSRLVLARPLALSPPLLLVATCPGPNSPNWLHGRERAVVRAGRARRRRPPQLPSSSAAVPSGRLIGRSSDKQASRRASQERKERRREGLAWRATSKQASERAANECVCVRACVSSQTSAPHERAGDASALARSSLRLQVCESRPASESNLESVSFSLCCVRANKGDEQVERAPSNGARTVLLASFISRRQSSSGSSSGRLVGVATRTGCEAII